MTELNKLLKDLRKLDKDNLTAHERCVQDLKKQYENNTTKQFKGIDKNAKNKINDIVDKAIATAEKADKKETIKIGKNLWKMTKDVGKDAGRWVKHLFKK